MKIAKLFLGVMLFLLTANAAYSQEAVNVGNKICPVSREVIAGIGEGKGVLIEHEGKVYNLCCAMCIKDFKKDPEKFIQRINEELENSGDVAQDDGGHEHSEHEH